MNIVMIVFILWLLGLHFFYSVSKVIVGDHMIFLIEFEEFEYMTI